MVICSLCEAVEATLQCHDCNQALCAKCFEDLHLLPPADTHRTGPVGQAAPHPSAQPLAPQPPAQSPFAPAASSSSRAPSRSGSSSKQRTGVKPGAVGTAPREDRGGGVPPLSEEAQRGRSRPTPPSTQTQHHQAPSTHSRQPSPQPPPHHLPPAQQHPSAQPYQGSLQVQPYVAPEPVLPMHLDGTWTSTPLVDIVRSPNPSSRDPVAAVAAATVTEVLREGAKKHGKKVAWQVGATPGDAGDKLTFKDGETLARLVAGGLYMQGVEARDRVCIVAPNSVRWVLAYLGTISVGGIACGVYPETTGDGWLRQIMVLAPSVVFTSDTVYSSALMQMVHAIPTLKAVVQWGKEAQDFPAQPPARDGWRGLFTWDTLLGLGAKTLQDVQVARRQLAVKTAQCASIVVTQGTAGPCKLVQLSHDNLTWTAKALSAHVSATKKDKLLCLEPLQTAAAQVWFIHLAMVSGATVHFPAEVRRPLVAKEGSVHATLLHFKPSMVLAPGELWESLAEKVGQEVHDDGGGSKTVAWALGTGKAAAQRAQGKVGQSPEVRHKGMMYGAAKMLVYKRILAEFGLDQCRYAGMIGAACSEQAQERLLSVGLPVLSCYGSTECCGVATVSTAKACEKKPGYRVGLSGRALAGTHVGSEKKGDAAFEELRVQGRNVMMGYYMDSASNNTTLLKGGVLLTGDLGSLEPMTGLVQVRGKKSDQITLTTGETVAPGAIEATLKHMLPFIGHAMVIGHGRPFVAIFLTLRTMQSTSPVENRTPLDPPTVARLRQKNIRVGTLEEATRSKELNDVVIEAIQRINQMLSKSQPSAPHVKRYILLRDWNVEQGELSPTLQLRRTLVMSKCQQVLEILYSDGTRPPPPPQPQPQLPQAPPHQQQHQQQYPQPPAQPPAESFPQEQYHQPPEQYHQPPDQYHQPPDQYHQPPEQYHQPPEQYHQPPEQYHQPSEQYHQPPEQYHQPPEQHQQPPEEYHQHQAPAQPQPAATPSPPVEAEEARPHHAEQADSAAVEAPVAPEAEASPEPPLRLAAPSFASRQQYEFGSGAPPGAGQGATEFVMPRSHSAARQSQAEPDVIIPRSHSASRRVDESRVDDPSMLVSSVGIGERSTLDMSGVSAVAPGVEVSEVIADAEDEVKQEWEEKEGDVEQEEEERQREAEEASRKEEEEREAERRREEERQREAEREREREREEQAQREAEMQRERERAKEEERQREKEREERERREREEVLRRAQREAERDKENDDKLPLPTHHFAQSSPDNEAQTKPSSAASAKPMTQLGNSRGRNVASKVASLSNSRGQTPNPSKTSDDANSRGLTNPTQEPPEFEADGVRPQHSTDAMASPERVSSGGEGSKMAATENGGADADEELALSEETVVRIEKMVLDRVRAVSNVMVVGQGEAFLSCLISLRSIAPGDDSLHPEARADAAAFGSTARTIAEAKESKRFRDYLVDGMARVNRQLQVPHLAVRKFIILLLDFLPPSFHTAGPVSLTQNVRRQIHSKYDRLIREIYSDVSGSPPKGATSARASLSPPHESARTPPHVAEHAAETAKQERATAPQEGSARGARRGSEGPTRARAGADEVVMEGEHEAWEEGEERVQLVLQMQMAEVQRFTESFCTGLRLDLCRSLQADARQVVVRSIHAGSVVATVGLLPLDGDDRTPIEMVGALHAQAADTLSVLRGGIYTSQLLKIQHLASPHDVPAGADGQSAEDEGEGDGRDAAEPGALCGVGIALQPHGDGSMYVARIVAGGAAERGGQLRLGDVLREVDGREVHGLEGEVVAGAMLGRAGSKVQLRVQRGGQSVDIEIRRSLPVGWTGQRDSPGSSRGSPAGRRSLESVRGDLTSADGPRVRESSSSPPDATSRSSAQRQPSRGAPQWPSPPKSSLRSVALSNGDGKQHASSSSSSSGTQRGLQVVNMSFSEIVLLVSRRGGDTVVQHTIRPNGAFPDGGSDGLWEIPAGKDVCFSVERLRGDGHPTGLSRVFCLPDFDRRSVRVRVEEGADGLQVAPVLRKGKPLPGNIDSYSLRLNTLPADARSAPLPSMSAGL